MRKLNHYRIIQWVVFMPLIVPLCLISGIIEGLSITFERIVEQIKMDVAS